MARNVVFDCNVYVQGLISPKGPAGKCVMASSAKQVAVFASEYILAEVRRVAARPHLANRFHLTIDKTERYLSELYAHIRLVDDVPHVFTYPRDPKDEHYVDLAIAVGAQLVVSRDRDLLALADANDPAGRDFQTRFPGISVVTPTELLAKIRLP